MALSAWIEKMFGAAKPVIAMAHIPALPGTPRYRRESGIEYLVESVQADVEKLVVGGVVAILFCNEDDRPYLLVASIEQIATMTRIVAHCAQTTIHCGIDVLCDPPTTFSPDWADVYSKLRCGHIPFEEANVSEEILAA